MPDSLSNLGKAHRYLKSIEEGTLATLTEFLAPGMTIEQLPNRIYPKGIHSGISQMAEAFGKGRKLLSSQTYEIKNHVVDGERVALEVLWVGKLAVPFGNLPAGSEMRAHSAMFFEFKDGMIISQRNYDCFEPW